MYINVDILDLIEKDGYVRFIGTVYRDSCRKNYQNYKIT